MVLWRIHFISRNNKIDISESPTKANGQAAPGKESLNATIPNNTSSNKSAQNSTSTKAAKKKKTRFSDDVTDMTSSAEPEVNDPDPGFFGSVINSVTSWWRGDVSHPDVKSNENGHLVFLNRVSKACLRVQQMGIFLDADNARKNDDSFVDIKPIELTQQPTNVYMSRRTFESHFQPETTQNHDEISTFIASLRFLPSPSQTEQILKRKMEKSSSHKARKSSASSQFAVTSDDCPCEDQEDQVISAVVRVVVLDDGKLYRLMGDNQVSVIKPCWFGSFQSLKFHDVIGSKYLSKHACLEVFKVP